MCTAWVLNNCDFPAEAAKMYFVYYTTYAALALISCRLSLPNYCKPMQRTNNDTNLSQGIRLQGCPQFCSAQVEWSPPISEKHPEPWTADIFVRCSEEAGRSEAHRHFRGKPGMCSTSFTFGFYAEHFEEFPKLLLEWGSVKPPLGYGSFIWGGDIGDLIF